MKKNGEYVGVDDKFIPEEDKYVDDSILGDKEEAIKTGKKVVVGLGVGYIAFYIISFILGGVVIFFGFKFFKDNFKKVTDITSGNAIENSGNSMLDKFGDIAGNIIDKAEDDFSEHENMQNEMMSKFEKEMFNSDYERFSGTNSKFILSDMFDKVVLNNKKNKNRILTIVYNDIEMTEEKDIVELKHSLDKNKDYEVSIDYNDDGLVNKITIYDIK